ncbi:NTP transferase domain-containing protein [Candidatus Sodalis endolongispinus]|uniref:NTP transferase domain-containing protein n=1 Tax=Candidatus Sodalis endolongispinus TaxID=2812662 RepID=UPI001FEA4E8A|nr:NTP transferase domain-containing protein [Candidatus Sodalis endolongispinus]
MLNIVIPMAGRGSRFSLAGFTDPKPLVKLNDKRMIEVVVNNLTPAQPHRFIFICQQEHLERYNYEAELENIAPDCIIIGIDGVT